MVHSAHESVVVVIKSDNQTVLGGAKTERRISANRYCGQQLGVTVMGDLAL